MAVVTIIKYVLIFAFGYIVYMLLGLIVYKTRYENPQWDNMPTSIIAFGDQAYGVWILFIPIIAAIILLSAWAASDRSRAVAS
jgi:energy-converting hydrogenase Eha subunit A